MTRSVRSAALEYHETTNVAAGGTDEDEGRFVGARPLPFKDYGDADRLPLEMSVAGSLLQRGAGIVRSQDRRDYGGGTIHWRAYSSAGALFPVEAYVATSEGLFSFDALGRSLVRVGCDVRGRLAEAAAEPRLARAEAIVVLTGIHARTGWKYLDRGYRHVWWDAGTMLANLLALAAAEGLRPRLYTAFVDRELNDVLGVDGAHEYALALLALGGTAAVSPAQAAQTSELPREKGRRFERAERLHRASSLASADDVRAWRSEPPGEEPRLDARALERAMRRRSSVRRYAGDPLPRPELAELLEWSEAPVPADAPSVVRQLVTIAAVEGLDAGIYDAELRLLRAVDERELRERVGFAAMEQEHPRDAAVNVFQLADVDAVVRRLGDRGYRWAQLEAGIRAGRLQVGAFMRNWGAAASTFYDDEVSRLLETHEAPMLMVSIGPR
jgi:SagB-type dehydrogenase family enzyme